MVSVPASAGRVAAGPQTPLPPLLPWLVQPLAQTLQQRGHALLLHGPADVGQFELGLALVAASLCEGDRQPLAPACGVCGACHLVRGRAHPDAMVLLPDTLREALDWPRGSDEERASDGKLKPSRQIRVDLVREAITWASRTPARGRGKWLLIHPASAMNAVTANALLKTLEEPSTSLRLVLCAGDPHALLPTILSRCQRRALGDPEPAAALAWLREQGVDGAEGLLAAAGGRPLEALALRADGIDAAAWSALPRRLAAGEAEALAGWPLPRAVDSLLKLCHDAMAKAVGGAPRYFAASALPPAASMAALVDWAEALRRVARHDEHPWQAALLIESLAAQARRALTPQPLDTLPA